MSFGAALAAGVLPFLLGDAVKIILSIAVGMPVRVRVRKAAFN
jgi:biotin transporter BioY